MQAADDSARLAELQGSVMSLTKQVQQLLPLQPRCSTLEVERDTAQHKLDQLQVGAQLQQQHCWGQLSHDRAFQPNRPPGYKCDGLLKLCLWVAGAGCHGLRSAVLCGLQEQHDQLQRQQQHAVALEGELRASLDTYKTEHMQLLSANAQLVETCQNLNKRIQVGHQNWLGACRASAPAVASLLARRGHCTSASLQCRRPSPGLTA